jgi:CheY-like chemotaxis protein/anti-sigma regulatory factor (Ser/Thr protein kinase)
MRSKKHILVVDDDPDVHRLLEAALEAPDRRIEGSVDGADGWKRIQSGRYDLILTDVSMPGLDGLTLLERTRKLRPQTPVVVMTAASTPEHVIRAIQENAFAYFSKPFTLDLVSQMVERALGATPQEGDVVVVSAVPHWLELRLRCKLETGDRILQFLRELDMDFPPAERDNIAMAFREILLNAIEHGGHSDPDKYVEVTYVRTRGAVLYLVRDPGSGFSFASLAHAAVSNPENAPFEHAEVREQMGMRPGGFGIFLTRQLVDEIIYSQAGNEVLLVKYLRSA